tara:strand:- start:1140 stop:1931 length:792 start_codon:yes stop_codon:yes gene_type:complete
MDGKKRLYFKIQKYYWRLKDFSPINYLKRTKDNIFISIYLYKIFGRKYSKFRFYSQQNEDKHLLKNFKIENVKNGTYLEVGAYDGVYFSNTLFLQNEFKFSGILIEPQKDLYEKLIKNRPSDFVVNSAISNSVQDKVEFIGDNLEAGIRSNIRTNLEKFPLWKSYKVDNVKMAKIIDKSGFKYIDVMFIDTEGSELEVIKSIDFSFPISIIIVEANEINSQEDQLMFQILEENGFKFYFQIRGNYWFYNQNNDRKYGIEFRKK